MQSADPTPPLDLDLRAGLPDALQFLLEEYPRHGWEAHPGYQGLISFWLDRHLMFRRLLDRLRDNAIACEAGTLDPRRHAAELARYGSMFVGELHGHHNIEDAHYFPVLSGKDPRIAAGFELLDKDHHVLDGNLNRFVERANGVLQPADDPARALGSFIETVHGLERMLDRHLLDEEDIVVPVILKYGAGGLA